jgi:lysozyme
MPIPAMVYSKGAESIAASFEGCELKAYHGSLDPDDVWTIGFGHTKGTYKGQEITLTHAYQFLEDDLREASFWVNRFVSAPLTQDEFDAVVDFTFNVGAQRFRDSTMRHLLNAERYHAAALEFEKWAIASGKRCAGILRRRIAEKTLFENVVYTDKV